MRVLPIRPQSLCFFLVLGRLESGRLVPHCYLFRQFYGFRDRGLSWSLEFDKERILLRPLSDRLTVCVDSTHELVIKEFDAFCVPSPVGSIGKRQKEELYVRIPIPLFRMSFTAAVAFRTLGNWTTATSVLRSGASLTVTETMSV